MNTVPKHTQEHILALARRCLLTPFRHQGRQIGIGLDCAGVAFYILDQLGLPYTDLTGYPRTPYKGMLKAAMDAQPSLRPVATPEPGDILLMRITRAPQHVAIYSGLIDGHPHIIHSYSTVEKVVEHVIDADWRARIIQAYRITP
ncbi:hypothetical protein D3879_14580 [Pseudomonas cavernicola]|uniref:NlpC/P60 domain-containing protein n=1 Tax=Pseudomonas cavernicola TaxID=2320866 RepID=A0A418XEE6_9PSED|nr:NlpC/P60 family protein [Pseudomonas cavernicola]RJG10904.1 hypothetical protein D3879_14580 [Pseudomonas cavernicola]